MKKETKKARTPAQIAGAKAAAATRAANRLASKPALMTAMEKALGVVRAKQEIAKIRKNVKEEEAIAAKSGESHTARIDDGTVGDDIVGEAFTSGGQQMSLLTQALRMAYEMDSSDTKKTMRTVCHNAMSSLLWMVKNNLFDDSRTAIFSDGTIDERDREAIERNDTFKDSVSGFGLFINREYHFSLENIQNEVDKQKEAISKTREFSPQIFQLSDFARELKRENMMEQARKDKRLKLAGGLTDAQEDELFEFGKLMAKELSKDKDLSKDDVKKAAASAVRQARKELTDLTKDELAAIKKKFTAIQKDVLVRQNDRDKKDIAMHNEVVETRAEGMGKEMDKIVLSIETGQAESIRYLNPAICNSVLTAIRKAYDMPENAWGFMGRKQYLHSIESDRLRCKEVPYPTAAQKDMAGDEIARIQFMLEFELQPIEEEIHRLKEEAKRSKRDERIAAHRKAGDGEQADNENYDANNDFDSEI